MRPLVTVIIPNYNYARYLPACLRGVIEQTYQELEIIVVDDGSTDESLMVANEFADKIKIVSQPHLGVNTARNNGLSHASGKYVAFCDSDDVWLPEKIEKQLLFMQSKPSYGLVYCGIQVVTDELIFIKNQNAIYSGDCSQTFLKKPGHAVVLLGASTALMDVKLVRDVNGFNEFLKGPGEDWDFFRRISKTTLFHFIDEPLVRYRQHNSSASKVDPRKYFEGNRAAMRKYYQDGGPEIKIFSIRFSWIKLNWTFFKSQLKKGHVISAISELAPGFGRIGYKKDEFELVFKSTIAQRDS